LEYLMRKNTIKKEARVESDLFFPPPPPPPPKKNIRYD